MPPLYYPDQYQQPPRQSQQYYQNFPQQNPSHQNVPIQGQYVPQYSSPVQVIIPQRQTQPYAGPNHPIPVTHPYQQHTYPYQQQYPPQPQTPRQFEQNNRPMQYVNEQQYTFNNQNFSNYQPPPPPQIMLPPRPSQLQQPFSPSATQHSFQISLPAPPQPSVKKETMSKRVLQNIEPNSTQTKPRPTTQGMTQSKPTVQSSSLSPQYPSLLLTLADEYIEAAKKLKERSEDYHQLVAIALGCIDVALRNFKLSPLREAQVSLKYAQLLYDETDNLNHAEFILTKSIELCDRMKFVDLKYAMQLLLAKVLYRSKPRVAIRDVQNMLADIETYRHVAWEYPFRFQAVFFAIENGDHSGSHGAFHQLEQLQHTAKQNSDHAIYAFAAVFESLLHLKTSLPDRITNSERAYAKAREVQLNPDVENHPQISVLLEFIDIMWTINTVQDEVLEKKRKSLSTTLYKHLDEKTWKEDGSIWLPINPRSLKGLETQPDGLIHEQNGRYFMTLGWIDRLEVEAIGFLINGVCIAPQNHYLRSRAEKYMTEGYKVPEEALQSHSPLISSHREHQRHLEMQIHFVCELAFMLCSRGQWDKAKQAVRNVEKLLEALEQSRPEFDACYDYLRGCIEQGTGNLDAALKWYQSASLVLPKQQPLPSPGKPNNSPVNNTVRDFAILASINTASIVRSPDHPHHYMLRSILDSIGPAATGSLNPMVNAAYTLVVSTVPGTQILRTKELLKASLDTAKAIANHQIIGLALTFMQDKFFRGGVQTPQAVKCAKAAAHSVKTRWGNPLWMTVSSMFEQESLVLIGGQDDEAKKKENEAAEAVKHVPEGVRSALHI